MLAALLLLQTPVDLTADARLDLSLAVEARIEPLPELLARLGKETGVALTVERRIEPLKVTAFCAPRPARATLAGLASVFDAEWVAQKEGGYRLEETVPAKNRREGYLAKEEALRREAIARSLTKPPEPPSFPPTGDAEKGAQRDEMFARSYRAALPALAAISALFRSLSGPRAQAFWGGEPIYALGRTEGAPEERTQLPNGGAIVRESPSGATLVLMRRVPDGRVQILYRAPNSSMGTGASDYLIGDPLKVTPFRRAREEWASDLTTATAPELDRVLEIPKPKASRWAKGWLPASDVLEWTYAASKVPIIAEASRRADHRRAELPGRTLREALLSRDRPSGEFRIEAGTLLHRPSRILEARRVEPPEVAMRAFERDAEPTLTGAAEMYAMLTDAAISQVRLHAARHDLDRFTASAETLRLWGRLSTGERRTLLEGRGLRVDGLKSGARMAVRSAVLGAFLDGGFGPGGQILRAERDERAPAGQRSDQDTSTMMGLLEFGPGGPYTLYAEGNASQRGTERTQSERAGELRSLALRIVDAEGRGLRMFGWNDPNRGRTVPPTSGDRSGRRPPPAKRR